MDDNLVKVFFQLTDALDGSNTESVWASMQPDGTYIIRNVPFYATGISNGDRIQVVEIENIFFYDKTIEAGGHSTYRIFCLDSTFEKFEFFLDILEKLGCRYERATEKLYGIDVLPSCDIYEVYKLLELGIEKGAWEFDEGHCGHLLVKGS